MRRIEKSGPNVLQVYHPASRRENKPNVELIKMDTCPVKEGAIDNWLLRPDKKS